MILYLQHLSTDEQSFNWVNQCKFARVYRGIIKSIMGLQIQSPIFKWLQALRIVKEGKRTQTSAVQLTEAATNKFFDGLFISTIVKMILREKGQEEAASKLDSIKQNSTPAIRLYNWNILTQGLKKLGYILDYEEKSKLLNLESDGLQRILRHLFSLKSGIQAEEIKKTLEVQTNEVGKKTLTQAVNIFQFLVISISKHFKLSVQHTLNLFLDNNKYLAHLLVKGVKGQYQPILMLIKDISDNIVFIVDSLFCIDEQINFNFFMAALKPCLISKNFEVADNCLDILKQLLQTYLQKDINISCPVEWMESDGINTLFFALKRHPLLFQKALSLAFAYIQSKLFLHIAPAEKSLLWANQIQQLTFYRSLLNSSHHQLLKSFTQSSFFSQWNRHCLKALKKTKTNQQICLLISIFQYIWVNQLALFQSESEDLRNGVIAFLKSCTFSASEIVFNQSSCTLFNLLIFLGSAKNSFAPVIFKTLVSCLCFQQKPDRIEFMVLNFLQSFKEIPSLPVGPLHQPLLAFLESPTATIIQLARVVLEDTKIIQINAQNILQALAKIFFYDIQYGPIAIQQTINYLKNTQKSQFIDHYCKACLSHFYSIGKDIHRPLRDIKFDFQRYHQEESMKKGEASFLKNVTKYLQLSNMVSFLSKSVALNQTFKEEVQPLIFHTYIKVKRELRKQYILKLLIPLLSSVADQKKISDKIKYYQSEYLMQSSQSSPIPIKSDQASSISQSSLKKSKKSNDVNGSHLKTEENTNKNGILAVMKQLQSIKKKRQIQRERTLMFQKEKDIIQQKKELYRSMVNQQRIIQFGKKHEVDVNYNNLLDFDSVKPQANIIGLPNIKLLHIHSEEETSYVQDFQYLIKKYRKIWRFLFFKYSSLGSIKQKSQMQIQQRISMAQIWKLLKEYQLDIIRKQESHMLVKKINQAAKRRTDLQNLTYLGFEEYLLQFCHFSYGRTGYAHLPPSRQILILLDQIKRITNSKGGNIQIFQNPDEAFFQETDVIRQFNRRLKENPDYLLPQGYKKVKQTELLYHYQIGKKLKIGNSSYSDVIQIIDSIIWDGLKVHIIQPYTNRAQKCLARPALFQKLKQKLKDYTGGYLMPKRSLNLSTQEKQISPMKIQYHPVVNFSLGIKLGLASVDIKLRFIAEEVAYWLDDALDAIEGGNLKVINKSKLKIQNDFIKRKRSSVIQIKLEKIEHQKKERARAETVKNQAQKYRQGRQATEAIRRSNERKLIKQKKEREDREIKRKLQQYQLTKNKLESKRKEAQQKKEAEASIKKKEKSEYTKNVEEYFKKKKQQLQQKQKNIKANKEFQIKKQISLAAKQTQKKKNLEIEVFKKEEEVLQKIVGSKQSYQQALKNIDIQKQMDYYRPKIKLFFDLLVKYEKSKVSSTGQNEIGFSTLNFFAIRTLIIPILVNKNVLTILFKAAIKQESRLGLNFIKFEEILFKITVKAKQTLNGNKKNGQNAQLMESEIQYINNSPEMQKDSKRTMTDDYSLQANGVRAQTYRKLMEFIDIPIDKQDAEQRFRQMLQNKNAQSLGMIMKQTKGYIDQTN